MQAKEALKGANPNTLPDHLRALGFAEALRGQIMQVVRRQDPAASAYQLAAVESISLPNDAKAASVLRATVIAGGAPGELTPVAYGVTPLANQIAVAPNGDIVVLAADAITSVDVHYAPDRGDVYTLVDYPVVADVLTLPTPATDRGVILLCEVEATEGTSTGKKVILVPGGVPAAGQAALDLAKATIVFNVADAVTKATVTLTLVAAKDLGAYLESESTTL